MQLCICVRNKTAPDHIQNFSGTCKYINPSPSFSFPTPLHLNTN